MNLPDYVQLSNWLSLFGQNMAVATVVVVLYAAIRPIVPEERPKLAALVIGIIFGLSAIVSMSTPFAYAAGVRFDMRDVFVLVGSLSGGAIGAAVTVAIAVAYRLYLGGAGAPIGVGGIIVFALVGFAFARRYGPRVRELGVGSLLFVGIVAALIDDLYGRSMFALLGLPFPPLEEVIALLLLITAGTAFLGIAINMTHYRAWQQTQRQLFNIFETTSDLIWETNAAEQFTLISGRVKSIMGYEPSEIVGRSRAIFNGRWQDADTETTYRKAIETHQPFNELKYYLNAKDGSQRIVSISGRPAFDAGNRFVGFRGIAADITGQQRAEAELETRDNQLREAQRHLARAQHVGNVGSVEVDIATDSAIWSDELYRLLGLSPEGGFSFEYFLSAFHPDDRIAMKEDRQALALGQVLIPSEFRTLRPDGEVRWLLRQVEVIRDQDGIPVRHVSTYLDITDSKRTAIALQEREADLRRSREHLALAQRVGMIGSAEVDARSDRSMWSDELFAILGLDPAKDDASGARFLSLVHPEDRAVAAQRRARGLTGLANESTEYRIIRPDGHVRWVQVRTDIVVDADGEPSKMISTVLDITDRKRIEIEKREQDERLRLNREHLDRAQRIGEVGSSEFVPSSRETWWSNELFAIFGLAPGSITPGRDAYLTRVHPDDRNRVRERLDRGTQGQNAGGAEYRIVRPDGEIRWIYAQSEIVRDLSGASIKIIGTMHDITDLKQAQLERSELERQLLQAQKMEAVGNLTGGIAHDFNNLLSVILGRLEMTAEELHDRPQLREWIETCIKAANRGATLTRSMLAFSRQQSLQPIDFDIAASVGELMELLSRTLGETIQIKVERAADLWVCHADPSQLQNALLNLALNARDAMPEGGKLTIETANARIDQDYTDRNADVAQGDYVVLSISDTGIGMPPEVAARAFDPFFTTKEIGKGSGLGLSMVYGFAKQSGGHVKIYSEIEHGTTIRLYLPRGRGSDRSTDAKDQSKILRTGTETILVVEDDSDMLELTMAMLKRLGYGVLSAGNGAEGLAMIESHPEIALLLTDVTLPGGTNGQVLSQRMSEIAPSLKTVFMSGYAQSAVFHHGHLDAGVRLLQKPFTTEQLAGMIRDAMDNH